MKRLLSLFTLALIFLGADGNHAKIGISTSGVHNYAIFVGMNQQRSYLTKFAKAAEMAGVVVLCC